jgi:hypothetical protein
MVTVNGGGIQETLDSFARKTVREYYFAAFIALIVLILYVIYSLGLLPFGKKKTDDKAKAVAEKFNPTSLMRVQRRSDYGGSERMTAGQGSKQRKNALFNYGRTATTGDLSLNQQANQNILNSPAFNCAGRKMQGNEAWAWQNKVANEPESMTSRPRSDSDLTKILAGR